MLDLNGSPSGAKSVFAPYGMAWGDDRGTAAAQRVLGLFSPIVRADFKAVESMSARYGRIALPLTSHCALTKGYA